MYPDAFCPLRSARTQLVVAGIGHATERYVSWLNDPEVVRHTEVVAGGHSLASVEGYVQSCLDDPRAILFAIEMDGWGHVGNLRLGAIDQKHRRATLALLIGEKAVWGQGVAADAIKLASNFAFATIGLHKLTAGIYVSHPASRRAFEKAGYECEATLREHAWVDGTAVDIWQMAKFEHD